MGLIYRQNPQAPSVQQSRAASMPIKIEINADIATLVSAAASTVYAIIAAVSLWMLSRQIQDARRFGAAPALYALLKELDDHMTAVRHLGYEGVDEAAAREAVTRCLEFFGAGSKHLRDALAFFPIMFCAGLSAMNWNGLLADPRFSKNHRAEHAAVWGKS